MARTGQIIGQAMAGLARAGDYTLGSVHYNLQYNLWKNTRKLLIYYISLNSLSNLAIAAG